MGATRAVCRLMEIETKSGDGCAGLRVELDEAHGTRGFILVQTSKE
jgi:hypothetical protein